MLSPDHTLNDKDVNCWEMWIQNSWGEWGCHQTRGHNLSPERAKSPGRGSPMGRKVPRTECLLAAPVVGEEPEEDQRHRRGPEKAASESFSKEEGLSSVNSAEVKWNRG